MSRACLKHGMSTRKAARYFNKDRRSIAKMLRHALSPLGIAARQARGDQRLTGLQVPTLKLPIDFVKNRSGFHSTLHHLRTSIIQCNMTNHDWAYSDKAKSAG